MRAWGDGHGELAVEGGVRVPLEIASSYRARTRGLLGRTRVEGALLLTPAASVHTFRMRFPLDIAYLDRHLRVIALHTVPPNRLTAPRLRSRHVLEAGAGAMAGWGMRPGVHVRVRVHPDGGRAQPGGSDDR
ncbi:MULTISPECIES: DUF192 domain-containing protein [unclassified Streptomyces]|uniref:DUF192 domain-containing protein n=1 Tax=unclassified Streptomyces TaxID=2593676 RepID=UPI0033EE6222